MKIQYITTAIAAAIVAAAPVAASGQVKIGGFIGDRIDDCIESRVMGQNVKEITEPFTRKDQTWSWQTEFWGKWVQGAIASYRYCRRPALYEMIERSVADITATRQPDGYIGNYAPDRHLEQWDVWGRKYTALGLIHWYRLSGDRKALEAACRLIDHLMTEAGPDARCITETGNYRGMASSSVLEPVMYLYGETGNRRYLDYAQYIVDSWETPGGPQLVSKALSGVDVAERFPHPAQWFSPENGQKAYEMMSCYVGLLELYKVTGERRYRDAVVKTVDNIIDTEINVAGSGSSIECWYHGRASQTQPTYHTMETCVTFTWMQICDRLLQLTGNPRYADQIETTLYNALLASLKDDASEIAKYSPLQGHRFAGEDQCGLHINCCNANGPRAFAMIPDFAVRNSGDTVALNYFGPLTAGLKINDRPVTLTVESDYPADDRITVAVDPQRPQRFTLSLRMPGWSGDTRVIAGGDTLRSKGGEYLSLTRRWQKGDRVEVKFDMPVRLLTQNGCQAVTRGPIVFARDSRFNDGFVDEGSVIDLGNKPAMRQLANYGMDREGEKTVSAEAAPKASAGPVAGDVIPGAKVVAAPDFAWIAVKVPAYIGQNLESKEARSSFTLCDFASAGNTWDPGVRYRVWLPQTVDPSRGKLY